MDYAIKLYEGLGYKRIENYPPYQHMDDAVCYAKDLSAILAHGWRGLLYEKFETWLRGNGFEGLIESQLNYRLGTSIYDYKQARTVNMQRSCC